MKIMKFGGTSVGSAQRIKNVADLILGPERNIVVVSAMSGTTNTLVSIANSYYEHDIQSASAAISGLEYKYRGHIEELYSTEEYRSKASDYVQGVLGYLRTFAGTEMNLLNERIILAQGELISTHLLHYHLQERGERSSLLPALEFMRLDRSGRPDIAYIREHLETMLAAEPGVDLFITQGFICRDAEGDVSNLQRGGSDYTATLIGAALGAREVQIWTDIDGMRCGDPRIVGDTRPVRHLYFEEASELGYFGAKILHPTCIEPAQDAGVPVRLLNTMDPQAPGTLIDGNLDPGTIKAVAAKDGITALRITSSRALLAHNFIREVFQIFADHSTTMDMITTSGSDISVAIDSTSALQAIVEDIEQYGAVSVDKDMSIVCVAGDMDWANVGFQSRAMEALHEIPVRMVSYGGSGSNISFLVKGEDKNRALIALNDSLFGKQ